MRSLIFDAGPVISLTMNNLLWILPELKKRFNGEFCITPAIKNEVADVPLSTRKFKFEAIQVIELINSGIFKIVGNSKIEENSSEILEIANHVFYAHEHPIKILHYGEVSAIAAALYFGCDTIVIDEKNTRMLVESPKGLRDVLEKTLHTHIETDNKKLKEFKQITGNLKVIRSTELLAVAYELGILNRYLGNAENIQNKKKELIEAVLWGAKLSGCAVSEKEIRQIVKLEMLKT